MENNSNLIKCPDLTIDNDPNNIQNTNGNTNEKNKLNLEKTKEKECQIKISQNLQIKRNNYNEIKDFLNKIEQDYSNKIKDDPDSLFEEMNEQRIIIWESSLYSQSSPLRKNSDSDILYSTLDRDDQQVIRNDCKRTRVRESVIIPGYPKILEAILTYYCSTKKICYKQGLNEVFGALVLLKYKFKNIKFSKLFDIGEVLIDQYLPNYFYEKEIYSLQSSLSLFVILLKYHEPSVYNRFDSNEIMPQMYATNAITTLMSGKLKLNIVYELWEKIIQSKDPLMIHFILVAHFIKHREMIINCDKSFLATLITTLSINTKEELNDIMDLAYEIREKTPYSYRILVNKIGFLKTNNTQIKQKYQFYKPQSIPAMPIFPLEIISITNKFTKECVDPKCINCILNKNYKKIVEKKEYILKWDDDFSINNGFLKFEQNMYHHICEKCDMKIEKKMQYILLDLRILNYEEEDDDTEKTGFLPMMINVDEEELKSEEFNKIITNRFIGERGNYHFIFLTSSTNTFSDFESKYYTENVSELDKKKMMFGLIKQRKIDKKLNLEDAQKNLIWKEIYKLKEYDNFRNVLKTMQKENFPYVGYVYDGFNEVHDMSIKFGYELLFHNPKNCMLCLEKNNKDIEKRKMSKKEIEKEEKIKNVISESLWEHKTKIIYSKINEIYSERKNYTFLCILIKYKNKVYKNIKQKVLIILLPDEFSIEFFKFESVTEYKDLNLENEILEKKKKILEYYDLGKEEDDKNKETELILFDKFHLNEIKSINLDTKAKNILYITIIENKDKLTKKQDLNTFEIVLDFSSVNDSKTFAKSFKNAIKKFKEKRNENAIK